MLEYEDLLDRDAACRFIGGTRPINASTLYRGIKAGIYPAPVRVAPNVSRWKKAALAAALARLIGDDAA